MGRYIDGEVLRPRTKADVLPLIGKAVRYVRPSDIDRSGRGYVFPRVDIIVDVQRRQVIFDNGSSEYLSDLIELQVIEDFQ